MSKKVLVNSMIVFSIMLFIISFIVGSKLEKKEDKAQKKEKQEQKIKEEEQFSYSNVEQDKNGSKGQPNESTSEQENKYILESDYPDLSNLEAIKEQEKEKAITLKDLYPQKDLDESNKVAEAFIRAYYPFNGDSPMENIENAKIHMSKALYDSFKKQQPARPTQTIYKKELITLEVYEHYNPSDKYITWNVRVSGKVFNSNGDINGEEIYDYSLKLIKEEGSYKVDKFGLNVAY